EPPRFVSPKAYTYTGQAIRVCIANPDYSKKYELVANYSDLPPPANSSSLVALLTNLFESRGLTPSAKLTINQTLLRAFTEISRCAGEGLTQLSDANLLSADAALRLLTSESKRLSATDAIKVEVSITELMNRVNQTNSLKECLNIEANIKLLQSEIDDPASTLEAADKAFLKERIEAGKASILERQQWASVYQFALTHLQTVRQNLFNLSSRANAEVDLVVRSTPLVYTAGASGKAQTIQLAYGKASDVARYSFQIRSLSYVRFGVSVGYSSTHSQSVSTTRNDLGVDVLRRTDDLGIIPMVVMTHYWCGADEREIQPWDRTPPCWKWNLAPTIAVGLPITTTNTLQHIFLGLVWQPIPAIGLIGGAHLGRVNRLRAEFSDGMMVPAGNNGFRPEVDTVETVTRLGWYVGAVITDATFIKLIRDALGSGTKK
ncbi:MAG TPA: hypothetical protein PK472_18585, partial [Pseudomonadota bacterium]|nr:hypothetical protein [Pseudomonadota bacterium]